MTRSHLVIWFFILQVEGDIIKLMQRFTPLVDFLSRTLTPFKVGRVYIEPTYWQAGTIIILLFLLVFTLARMRWLYVNWHLGKHSFSMLFWGFLLAIIIEGFLLVGGRTIFTEVLGLRSVPKPLSTILDIGRARMVKVLGVEDEVPANVKSVEVEKYYNMMSIEEKEKFFNSVCKPL
ncbi:hypothetical protein A2628_03190 [Candidatus Woesebacteria bacterium RIFCSPHIGHO2_01_FULL_40_22]|uniref:Uncharacterized protein n=1 Tax=Candidatus Woesebacteria bacterium RIFCSPHIGHO2_01_FULL_40_22 TaxID=1802499 RepID=A0A1F7YGR0_9BACT|nr:MAG: hypothetical protein A2628_03190 [Candidatus Woesebacteria bacterium RIFCSPHIGHO2_01_FULL_40_22]